MNDLTIGDLRRALAQGKNEQTVTEALQALRKDDAVNARHVQVAEAYRTYVQARSERLRATEIEAMAECDRERQRSGLSWPDDEARARARREAGLAARDRFELDEPLLEFAEWVEAGSPERYQAKNPAERRRTRIDQLVRGGR